MGKLEADVEAAARSCGFDLCGFARAGEAPHGEFFSQWLARGNAASMEYLAAGREKRLDPRRILPGVRTIISLGVRYAPPPLPPVRWREELRGRMASYAIERDYHDVLRKRLKRFAAVLRASSLGIEHRVYVDAGPVLERDWAAESGLGWFGKNTNMLHKAHGSWFFLAEVLTTLELEPTAPTGEHCGTCESCLVQCPTGALLPGYELDARRCISYWTIEHRGAIPTEMRSGIGNWVFGCDVCQEVCPWNEKMRPPSASDARLTPYLPDLLALDESAFRDRFRGLPVRRAKREGLLRNVAVVLGNTGNPDAEAPLLRALVHEPSSLVRGHVAWALGQLGGRRGREALNAAMHTDPDALVRREAALALATAPHARAADLSVRSVTSEFGRRPWRST